MQIYIYGVNLYSSHPCVMHLVRCQGPFHSTTHHMLPAGASQEICTYSDDLLSPASSLLLVENWLCLIAFCKSEPPPPDVRYEYPLSYDARRQQASVHDLSCCFSRAGGRTGLFRSALPNDAPLGPLSLLTFVYAQHLCIGARESKRSACVQSTRKKKKKKLVVLDNTAHNTQQHNTNPIPNAVAAGGSLALRKNGTNTRRKGGAGDAERMQSGLRCRSPSPLLDPHAAAAHWPVLEN